jgi:23S rRNA (pseudouridine1915-N3)-methyltransferase
MLIKIIAVGKIKDKSLQAKIDEFCKWISPYAKLEIQELKDSSMDKEGVAIIRVLEKEKGHVFVMTEEGSQFTSEKFSKKLSAIDSKIVFVIGGPFGISPDVKHKADTLLSLSKMTFTHEMARLFLIEQIYRAINIAKGGKYHNP